MPKKLNMQALISKTFFYILVTDKTQGLDISIKPKSEIYKF